MMIYICTKFHENILNGIRVMERTRKGNGGTNGRPDRRTDGGFNIIRPVFAGRIKIQRGIILQNCIGVMALIFCRPSDVTSYLFKNHENFIAVQSFRTDTVFILNIPKANKSEKKMVELWFLYSAYYR